MKFILVLLLLTGCFIIEDKPNIKIINNSILNFDSSVISINNYELKLDYLITGDNLITSFLKNNVSGSHNVIYQLKNTKKFCNN